jgi:hypothetical protein
LDGRAWDEMPMFRLPEHHTLRTGGSQTPLFQPT